MYIIYFKLSIQDISLMSVLVENLSLYRFLRGYIEGASFTFKFYFMQGRY